MRYKLNLNTDLQAEIRDRQIIGLLNFRISLKASSLSVCSPLLTCQLHRLILHRLSAPQDCPDQQIHPFLACLVLIWPYYCLVAASLISDSSLPCLEIMKRQSSQPERNTPSQGGQSCFLKRLLSTVNRHCHHRLRDLGIYWDWPGLSSVDSRQLVRLAHTTSQEAATVFAGLESHLVHTIACWLSVQTVREVWSVRRDSWLLHGPCASLTSAVGCFRAVVIHLNCRHLPASSICRWCLLSLLWRAAYYRLKGSSLSRASYE